MAVACCMSTDMSAAGSNLGSEDQSLCSICLNVFTDPSPPPSMVWIFQLWPRLFYT
uniref:Zinc finger RING-type eukaryotic domain-containing protein n=1 Tax=Amphilophus citrinellus TaxID=61819 RepID=A0A3Q0RQJ1_AMPCI